jgi:hypothetical protein
MGGIREMGKLANPGTPWKGGGRQARGNEMGIGERSNNDRGKGSVGKTEKDYSGPRIFSLPPIRSTSIFQFNFSTYLAY